MMNILNGGKHADNNVDFQEFMIQPWGFDTFSEGLRAGVEIYHALKKVLHKNKMSTAVGDEGGFAPDLKDNEDALKVIGEAASAAGYELGKQVFIALDPAASELWDKEKKGYKFFKSNPDKILEPRRDGRITGPSGLRSIRSARSKTAAPKTTGTAGSCSPIGSATRSSLSATMCSSRTSSSSRRGSRQAWPTAILVKVNQIGTLSETFAAVEHGDAQRVHGGDQSHRSGETEDATIADIAVATNCGQIKTGAPARSDRVAKYNQLLRIEEQLGERADYGSKRWMKRG